MMLLSFEQLHYSQYSKRFYGTPLGIDNHGPSYEYLGLTVGDRHMLLVLTNELVRKADKGGVIVVGRQTKLPNSKDENGY